MRYGWHFDKDYQKGDRQKDGEGRHFQGLDWLGPYCISGLLACAGCWGVGRQEGEEATYTTQVSGSEEKRELLIEQLKDVGFTTPTGELKFWKRGVRTDGSAINRTNQIPTGQGTGSGFGGTLRDAPYGYPNTYPTSGDSSPTSAGSSTGTLIGELPHNRIGGGPVTEL